MRVSPAIITAALVLFAVGCRTGSPAVEQGRMDPVMADVFIFHHALGVTGGIEAFAKQLRGAGHRVIVPDLFDGRTFDSIEEGVAYAEKIGFDSIIERGVAAVPDQHGPLIVIGFSLGVMPAQKLAQTRPGVVGAVLCHSAVPPAFFGEGWPGSVALQMHLVEGDPWAEEDLEAARDLASAANGKLYLYPGTGHLVADPSHSDYDSAAAAQIQHRVLRFLSELP